MDYPSLCKQIVENAQDAVIFADRDGVIRLWNRWAEHIFGYSAEEAIGQGLDLIVPEKHRQAHWAGYKRVMKTGQTRYDGRLLAVPALRKNGERVSLEFSITLLKDQGGKVLGAAAIIRDVTERFLKDRELKKRLEELEAKVME